MAIISGTTEQISTIKYTLKSAHQTISNNISYIIQRLVFIGIQVYQYRQFWQLRTLVSDMLSPSTITHSQQSLNLPTVLLPMYTEMDILPGKNLVDNYNKVQGRTIFP